MEQIEDEVAIDDPIRDGSVHVHSTPEAYWSSQRFRKGGTERFITTLVVVATGTSVPVLVYTVRVKCDRVDSRRFSRIESGVLGRDTPRTYRFSHSEQRWQLSIAGKDQKKC